MHSISSLHSTGGDRGAEAHSQRPEDEKGSEDDVELLAWILVEGNGNEGNRSRLAGWNLP